MRYFAMLLLIPSLASAANIPSVRTPSGYDRVQTSEGLRCESSIASDTYIQTGIYSVNGSEDNEAVKDTGIFAQVVIPLTGARKRLDCSRLYELELKGRELEIQRLQKQIELLNQQGVKIYE